MKLLYALESIRTPLLDTILGAVTHMGGELFFMVIAVTVFWCVSKRMGYYLMTVGFFGTILNQFLKILCCVPRPWVKDPGFTIVESARAEATGYSFPSGHTQNAVATYGGIARYTRRRWLRGVCIALTLVICFSRMYLGVHTPLDVGVSFVIAAALVLLVYPLMEEADRRPRVLTAMIGVMVLCSAAFIVYLYLRGDTGTTAEDTANYVSALQNAWKLTGRYAGNAGGQHSGPEVHPLRDAGGVVGPDHQAGGGLRTAACHPGGAESAAHRAVRRGGGDRRRYPLSAGGAVRRMRMAPDVLGLQPGREEIRR